MIIRFLTGPGIPGTIWPVGIHSTWDEAVGAVAALGGFAMAVSGKREDEMLAKIGKCACEQSAQPYSVLCEQCERALIDRQKPAWAIRGRDGNETHTHLPDVQTDDAD